MKKIALILIADDIDRLVFLDLSTRRVSQHHALIAVALERLIDIAAHRAVCREN